MVKVNLIGFKEFEARIKKAATHLQEEVAFEIQNAGEEFAGLAKNAAPMGPTGQLAGSISSQVIDPLHIKVVAQKKYAPYIEWGTITKVNVPGELSEYAAQFKGSGLRKTGGIIPRPFFFKQMPIVRNKLVKQIDTILKGI